MFRTLEELTRMITMRLLVSVAICVVNLGSIHNMVAQANGLDDKIRSELLSADWSERANAMVQLARLDSVEARHELIRLLGRENQLDRSSQRGGQHYAEDRGEEYIEYVGQLGDLVLRFADDPNYPEALYVLVEEAGSPDGYFSRWLAGHGEAVTIPIVTSLSKSDLWQDRELAIGVSAEMLSREKGQSMKMSNDHRMLLKQIVHEGATDSNDAVKYQSIQAMIKIGDPSDKMYLQKIVRACSVHPDDKSKSVLSGEAQKAIEQLPQE